MSEWRLDDDGITCSSIGASVALPWRLRVEALFSSPMVGLDKLPQYCQSFHQTLPSRRCRRLGLRIDDAMISCSQTQIPFRVGCREAAAGIQGSLSKWISTPDRGWNDRRNPGLDFAAFELRGHLELCSSPQSLDSKVLHFDRLSSVGASR